MDAGNILKGTAVAVVAIIVVIVVAVQSPDRRKQSRPWAAPARPAPAGFHMPGPQTAITYDKYMRLYEGMSYAQALQVIGAPGQETSSSVMPAVPGVMDAIRTVSYSWVNPGGGNAMLMFQNDKLTTKAQFGLR